MSEFVEQNYTPKYSVTIWNTKNARAANGAIIEGKVIDVAEEPLTGPDGKSKTVLTWTIEQKSGDKIKTPGHAQLIGKMDKAEVGDEVRIRHDGLIEMPNGKTGRGYTVWIKKN
jgi:hypothetical protein